MITIVYAHPWSGSFNQALLTTLTDEYTKQGKPFQIIDLYKDRFNPVFSADELAVYNQGKFIDPLIGRYHQMIKNTDEIVFLFPIWWGSMPAILKGFFDKVFLVNFAFSYENGWTPLLDIPKTTVITTSESPTDMYHGTIEKDFIELMLGAVGIKNGIWYNNDRTGKGSDEDRKAFLSKVKELASL